AAKARAELQTERIGDNSHRAILRLQGLNALGDVAIVNVGAIDVHEMLDRGGLVAGGFIGRGQFVIEGNAGFAINGGYAESLLVPPDGSLGHALFQEALCQPGVGLHDLRERMSAIERLAGLLQFSDGFVEQSHFAEGNTEVVMRFWIFVGGSDVGLEVLLEFAKHFREVHTRFFAERRNWGGSRSGRRMGSRNRRRMRLGSLDCRSGPGYGSARLRGRRSIRRG